jgi:hypothetical protein
MEEPLKPPSQQPRRFFDIVPSTSTVPSATSRPIITTGQAQPIDPVMAFSGVSSNQVTAEPKVSVAPEVSPLPEPLATISSEQPTAGDYMMKREYQEIEHELPAGPLTDEDRLLASVSADETMNPTSSAVVVNHGKSSNLTRKFILALVIIVLVILAADLLLDSGVWKLGHSIPHTHFWHQTL